MIGYVCRCLKRQLTLSHIWSWFKLLFSFIGTLYTVLKVLLLIQNAYKEEEGWGCFCDFVKCFAGEWVIWELLTILILTIIVGWKRIKTTYILKTGQKIVFDYCSILKQHGDIVIEVPNSFTTKADNIERDSIYFDFLKHYKRINKSEALLEIIKKNLKAKAFKPFKSINAHKEQERYELGSFCEIVFDGRNYLLAASFRSDNNNRIVSEIDDFDFFLCQLWANLTKHGADRKELDIPIFGEKGRPYGDKLTTDKKIYQILKTYIYNAKKNASCTKELHICFYDNKDYEVDLDKFVTIAKYIDEFRTEEYDDKNPQGTGLD